jgi:hypothetical protein
MQSCREYIVLLGCVKFLGPPLRVGTCYTQSVEAGRVKSYERLFSPALSLASKPEEGIEPSTAQFWRLLPQGSLRRLARPHGELRRVELRQSNCRPRPPTTVAGHGSSLDTAGSSAIRSPGLPPSVLRLSFRSWHLQEQCLPHGSHRQSGICSLSFGFAAGDGEFFHGYVEFDVLRFCFSVGLIGVNRLICSTAISQPTPQSAESYHAEVMASSGEATDHQRQQVGGVRTGGFEPPSRGPKPRRIPLPYVPSSDAPPHATFTCRLIATIPSVVLALLGGLLLVRITTGRPTTAASLTGGFV